MGPALLLLAVAGLVLGHGRIRPSAVMAATVATVLATGTLTPAAALRTLGPLVEPLAFVLLAVPMAVLMDQLGMFEAVAARLPQGHRLAVGLWVMGAVTTTVLNLDAAIVLLTPLLLRLAPRIGADPVRLALQPVLLAALASSALPVSNLTNLIAAERHDLGALAFLVRLGPASLVACAVGWWGYRRVLGAVTPPADPPAALVDLPGAARRRAERIGAAVCAVLVPGFTLGDLLGVPAWAVVAPVLVGLALVAGTRPRRSVPWEVVAVAGGLAVLARAAAGSVPVDAWLAGSDLAAQARAFVLGVAGADLTNNLPALLVGLEVLEPGATLWAFLAGVNLGPVLWVSGSLAGLLWLDVLHRFGHRLGPLDYARWGVRIGLPALLTGGATVLATTAVTSG